MSKAMLLAILLFISTSSFFIEQNSKQQIDVNVGNLLKLRTIQRNIDGSNNNQNHPDWGKSYTNLKRRTPVRYQDGKSEPLKNLPNPRYLSETISKLPNN